MGITDQSMDLRIVDGNGEVIHEATSINSLEDVADECLITGITEPYACQYYPTDECSQHRPASNIPLQAVVPDQTWSIYPNGNSVLIVNEISDVPTLVLGDLSGRVIKRFNNVPASWSQTVNNLPTGIYVVTDGYRGEKFTVE